MGRVKLGAKTLNPVYLTSYDHYIEVATMRREQALISVKNLLIGVSIMIHVMFNLINL